jgi:hypothetical protein
MANVDNGPDETARGTLKSRLRAAHAGITGVGRLIRRFYAVQWLRLDKLINRVSQWQGFGTPGVIVALFVVIPISFYFTSDLQRWLEPFFAVEIHLATLQTLFVTVGSALLGAAAVAFAVVMFAVQVNVERTPYGLFRKLSTDMRLLAAFGGTFTLAILVATCSLMRSSCVALAMVVACWATLLILLLLLYAYARALRLVSPTEQLRIILEDSQRDLRKWLRRAKRATPLLEVSSTAAGTGPESALASNYDLPRVNYFRFNSQWTSRARKGLRYAVSLARHYAQKGDNEITQIAFDAVVEINAAYIATKGKTFFPYIPFSENRLSSDTFLNETLEQVRLEVRTGFSRGDETQVEGALKALARLAELYLGIDYGADYGADGAPKTHAQVAAGYLDMSVRETAIYQMPSVTMRGVEFLAELALGILARQEPNQIAIITENVGAISRSAAVKDALGIVQSGMRCFAQLTYDLLMKSSDIRYAANVIRRQVSQTAKWVVAQPDNQFSMSHIMALAPYYSTASNEALAMRLAEMANALSEAKPDDETARTFVRNASEWANELYRGEKELLLAATESRSNFTSELMQWISLVTKILLALSNTPPCDDETQKKLREAAVWLISILSFVPHDKDAVVFLERCRMTDILFAAALDAKERDSPKVFDAIVDLLLAWAFRAGRHHTPWAILERVLCGLATLTIAGGRERSKLLNDISVRLSSENAPDQQTRHLAAQGIRERAASLHSQSYVSSDIEIAMSKVDGTRLRPLLEEVASELAGD